MLPRASFGKFPAKKIQYVLWGIELYEQKLGLGGSPPLCNGWIIFQASFWTLTATPHRDCPRVGQCPSSWSLGNA